MKWLCSIQPSTQICPPVLGPFCRFSWMLFSQALNDALTLHLATIWFQRNLSFLKKNGSKDVLYLIVDIQISNLLCHKSVIFVTIDTKNMSHCKISSTCLMKSELKDALWIWGISYIPSDIIICFIIFCLAISPR